MRETVVPACSPGLRQKFGIETATDLRKAPLVHLDSRPDAWARWFEAQGLDASAPRGMQLDQFALAAQAAIAGLGVALLPRFLIESELACNDLVLAAGRPMESAEAYYLAWPESRTAYPPLQAFRQWLLKESVDPSVQGPERS